RTDNASMIARTDGKSWGQICSRWLLVPLIQSVSPVAVLRSSRRMANQLFARKSIETLVKEMEGENRLHRVLGPVSLTSLGVGAIIGAGIFAMTGQVAAEASGPAVIISYIVAGLGCAFAALC